MPAPSTQGLRSLREIPQEEREALERVAQRIEYHPGQTVFREGEPADFALLLLEGRMSVVVETARGRRVVGDVWPGEVVGETALLGLGEKRNATVLAQLPSVGLIVDSSLLERARGTRARAVAQKQLLLTMSRRIRATNGAIRKAWQEQRAAEAQPTPEPEAPEAPVGLRDRLNRLLGGLL